MSKYEGKFTNAAQAAYLSEAAHVGKQAKRELIVEGSPEASADELMEELVEFTTRSELDSINSSILSVARRGTKTIHIYEEEIGVDSRKSLRDEELEFMQAFTGCVTQRIAEELTAAGYIVEAKPDDDVDLFATVFTISWDHIQQGR